MFEKWSDRNRSPQLLIRRWHHPLRIWNGDTSRWYSSLRSLTGMWWGCYDRWIWWNEKRNIL